jgi:hypothetical protein
MPQRPEEVGDRGVASHMIRVHPGVENPSERDARPARGSRAP